jgi:hypothetical protein
MKSLDSLTPLHGLAALMTAGSLFYGGGWLTGKIDNSDLPSELFAEIEPSKGKLASPTERILYKNYILGLLLTPSITLGFALWDGSDPAVRVGAISAGAANGMYALHLALTSSPQAFKEGMREAASISHGIVAGICFWQASCIAKK